MIAAPRRPCSHLAPSPESPCLKHRVLSRAAVSILALSRNRCCPCATGGKFVPSLTIRMLFRLLAQSHEQAAPFPHLNTRIHVPDLVAIHASRENHTCDSWCKRQRLCRTRPWCVRNTCHRAEVPTYVSPGRAT